MRLLARIRFALAWRKARRRTLAAFDAQTRAGFALIGECGPEMVALPETWKTL